MTENPWNIQVEALEKAWPIFEERGYPEPVRPEGMDDEDWEFVTALPPVVWRYEDGVILSREVPSHLTGAAMGLLASALMALFPGDPDYDEFEKQINIGYDLYKEAPNA